MNIQRPKGTQDVMPAESYKWHFIEETIREISALNGYREVRTPVFEYTTLFERGVGETTDIVQKEMYTFSPRKDKNSKEDFITLKPEGTAPAVRAFVEHGVYGDAQPTKMYYIIPCFRYEKPQAGRLREFHQFGIEVFGSKDPSVDAEVINVAMTLFEKLGIKDLELRVNSVGCPICRTAYNKLLIEYLEPKMSCMCGLCTDRYEKNPMRILDCKEERCQEQLIEVPFMADNLCPECEDHFDKFKKSLELIGLNYIVDKRIVRGLDYYTKTAFEIVSNNIGAQGTVCGGGRYDGLIEDIGGPATPGVGFGLGLERLLMVIENSGNAIPEPRLCDLFVAYLGERGEEEAIKLVHILRKAGIKAEKDYLSRSFKAQMKYANKIKAAYVAVIGENEIDGGKAKIKNMADGSETEVLLKDFTGFKYI